MQDDNKNETSVANLFNDFEDYSFFTWKYLEV